MKASNGTEKEKQQQSFCKKYIEQTTTNEKHWQPNGSKAETEAAAIIKNALSIEFGIWSSKTPQYSI